MTQPIVATASPMAYELDGKPSLPVLLLRARVIVARQFNQELRQHGLTEQQWRVLRSLSGQDHADVTQLAESADLLPSSVSRILRDLAARKFLTRSTALDDARRMLATITPEGRLLVDETMADVGTILSDIENLFGTKKLNTLRMQLIALIETLGGKT